MCNSLKPILLRKVGTVLSNAYKTMVVLNSSAFVREGQRLDLFDLRARLFNTALWGAYEFWLEIEERLVS